MNKIGRKLKNSLKKSKKYERKNWKIRRKIEELQKIIKNSKIGKFFNRFSGCLEAIF